MKATKEREKDMEKKFTTKEVVVVAMVAAVIGVIYTLLDWAYMPLSAVLGTVFMELTFGVYMLRQCPCIWCASRDSPSLARW